MGFWAYRVSLGLIIGFRVQREFAGIPNLVVEASESSRLYRVLLPDPETLSTLHKGS